MPSRTWGRTKRQMSGKVTVEDVERVAELANLELQPEELQSMLHDLNAVLSYVAQLNELDTSAVIPLAQVSELEGAAATTRLRQDVHEESLERSTVMSLAPDTDQTFFKVPKVIDR
jgi:aspartyl-tRNA(Asn)/glutamyl-tRNA(Gln) amidotransferase subunit C